MELPPIFSSTLGLSLPWEIKAVSFAKHEKRLDITVHVIDSNFLPCPICGSAGNHCLTELETWHHGSFLDFTTYLHARVPHIECCGSVIPVERPWSRQGSKFSLLC
jgi:transposase